MKSLLVLVTGLLLAIGPVIHAEDPPLPKSLVKPETAYARAYTGAEKDVLVKLKLVVEVPKEVPETVTVYVTQKKSENGVEYYSRVPVEKTVNKTVMEPKGWRDVILDLANSSVSVVDSKGEAVPKERIVLLLEKESPVLVYKDSTIDPFHLLTVKEETLVIVAPSKLFYQQDAEKPNDDNAAPQQVQPVQPQDAELSDEEKELLDLSNAERKKAGIPVLTASPLLFQAARQHSANMAKRRNASHTLDEKGVADRLSDLKYPWTHCAENIAVGQRSSAEAIASWMYSPGHRANLLSSQYTEIGVSFAKGTDGRLYWTMVLAASR